MRRTVQVLDHSGVAWRHVDVDVNIDALLLRDNEGILRTYTFAWKQDAWVPLFPKG